MQAQDSFVKKPIFWALMGGLVIVGFVMTQPEEQTGSSIKTAKPKPKVSISRSGTVFTDEDFKAKFTPVNSPAKNTFKPIIAKGGGLSGGSGPSNLIPTSYASGEGSWILTGTAEVDGVPMALLENKSTMDGVFLKAGERWKSAVVERITSNSVVLGGPAGSITLSWIVADEPAAAAPAAGNQPVNPMNGAIGINPGMQFNPGGGGAGMNFGGRGGMGGGRGNDGGGRGNGGGGRGNRGGDGGGGGRGSSAPASAPAVATERKTEVAVTKEVAGGKAEAVSKDVPAVGGKG